MRKMQLPGFIVKAYKGASLLEIMLSLLLGAALLTTIFRYSYFLESSVNYAASQIGMIEKNNVLFAWIVSDIEMAGYLGCVNVASRKFVINADQYLSDYWLKNYGDSLLSQYMSTEQFLIIEKLNANEILIDGYIMLDEGDIVILENCFAAQAMKIKRTKSREYGTQEILEFYDSIQIENLESSYVAKLVRHHYFIKNNGFYVTDEKGKDNQLLENMQALQIENKQRDFMVSIVDSENNSPVILKARAYNAS